MEISGLQWFKATTCEITTLIQIWWFGGGLVAKSYPTPATP